MMRNVRKLLRGCFSRRRRNWSGAGTTSGAVLHNGNATTTPYFDALVPTGASATVRSRPHLDVNTNPKKQCFIWSEKDDEDKAMSPFAWARFMEDMENEDYDVELPGEVPAIRASTMPDLQDVQNTSRSHDFVLTANRSRHTPNSFDVEPASGEDDFVVGASLFDHTLSSFDVEPVREWHTTPHGGPLLSRWDIRHPNAYLPHLGARVPGAFLMDGPSDGVPRWHPRNYDFVVQADLSPHALNFFDVEPVRGDHDFVVRANFAHHTLDSFDVDPVTREPLDLERLLTFESFKSEVYDVGLPGEVPAIIASTMPDLQVYDVGLPGEVPAIIASTMLNLQVYDVGLPGEVPAISEPLDPATM